MNAKGTTLNFLFPFMSTFSLSLEPFHSHASKVLDRLVAQYGNAAHPTLVKIWEILVREDTASYVMLCQSMPMGIFSLEYLNDCVNLVCFTMLCDWSEGRHLLYQYVEHIRATTPKPLAIVPSDITGTAQYWEFYGFRLVL